MDKDILEYLKGERTCVLAVEMMDGAPHASTVHFATTEDPFCFIFETDKNYRKSEPLFGRESTRASLVLGTVEGKTETFQLDGIAALTEDEAHKAAYLAKFPEKAEKAKGENVIFFTFTPTWWRFTEWTKEGKKIRTS